MRHCQSIFLAIALTALTACEPAPTELRLITPKSPIDREIAEDFANLLGRESAVTVTLVPAPEGEQTDVVIFKRLHLTRQVITVLEDDYVSLGQSHACEQEQYQSQITEPVARNIVARDMFVFIKHAVLSAV